MLDESATVTDSMRLKYHRGNVIAKLMSDARPRMTIQRLAKIAGVSRGTVNGLLTDKKATEPAIVDAIMRALGTNVGAVTDELRRLNQEPQVVVPLTPRTEKTRQEDRDPIMDEAVAYGKRIGKLPLAARSALFAVVAALEEAYRDR